MRFCRSWLFSFVVLGVIIENSSFQGQKKSIWTAKNTLVLSQLSILPALKGKERVVEMRGVFRPWHLGFYLIISNQCTKNIPVLSLGRKGLQPCFPAAQNPFWKLNFCGSPCHPHVQILAQEAGLWWSSTEWASACVCWGSGRHMYTLCSWKHDFRNEGSLGVRPRFIRKKPHFLSLHLDNEEPCSLGLGQAALWRVTFSPTGESIFW